MKKILIIILIVVVVAGAAAATYVIIKKNKDAEKKTDPNSGSSMLPLTDPKETDVSASFKSMFTNPQAKAEIKAAGSKIKMTGIKLPGLN